MRLDPIHAEGSRKRLGLRICAGCWALATSATIALAADHKPPINADPISYLKGWTNDHTDWLKRDVKAFRHRLIHAKGI